MDQEPSTNAISSSVSPYSDRAHFNLRPPAVSLEAAYQSARLTALSMLASLKRELGDLERVATWLRVFGMVNAAQGFTELPQVINGCSDLILELYGPESSSPRPSSAVTPRAEET